MQKIATQIPTVQSPADVDAEESSFESQFNALTASSGVTLTQFNGFTPATATAAAPTTTRSEPSDVTPVPTTLTVTGNYGQVSAFINGLDGFPRLFVIQNFVLSYGVLSATSASSIQLIRFRYERSGEPERIVAVGRRHSDLAGGRPV